MPRRLAYEALRSSADRPLLALERLERAAELEPRDLALARHIVATETRRRATLRALVRLLCDRKPSADVAAHLHVGLVQLYFLNRIPDHAAVSETVASARHALGHPKGRFVNAVLRKAVELRREGPCDDPRRNLIGADRHVDATVFRDPNEHPLLWAEDALSMPAPILKRWIERFGEPEAQRLARAALLEPPLSLRARDQASFDELRAELDSEGARPGGEPLILLVPVKATERALGCAAFVEGRATVQGGTAATAARLVEASAGERILELCAAPGGKTLVLAESGASVVAADVNPTRLERVRENLARAGLGAGVSLVACDGASTLAPERFDAVLVDVPCSNTGVLAQRPDARWRFGPKSQQSLRELQTRLLAEAAERVRPGGRLVYSTCSLERDEDEARVKVFLGEHADFELVSERFAVPRPEAPPGPIDGGYAARLLRRE